MLLRTFLALGAATLVTAQWQWAHLSGEIENVAYDATPESDTSPPADNNANVWTTAGGDLWILRNRRDKEETQMWRWARVESKWMLMMSTAQDALTFEPPPRPDNYGQETHPDLITADDAYEEAERRAAELAAQKSQEQNLENSDRQLSVSESITPAKATGELPQGRLDAATDADAAGGRLFMFGGRGGYSRRRGDHLWMYEITEGKWTLLSGGNIDYSTGLCSVSDSRNNPKNGPCVISSSIGHDELVYYEGQIYLVVQERENNQHRLAIWCYDVDGSREWSFLGIAGENGPAATTFSVPVRSYAYDGSLYVYRALQVVGKSGAVAGELWKFNIADKSWNLIANPALPMERTATWMFNGMIVTHMPGDMRAGVAGNRQIPDVDNWEQNSDDDRFVLYDIATGKYAAVQKNGVDGRNAIAVEIGEFSHSSTPGRRFSGAHTYAATGDGEAYLFMYGGSLVHKRNPDQRNDFWVCKIDIGELREKAGF